MKTCHYSLFDTNKNVKNIIVLVEDITENQELITNIQELKKNNELLKESYDYSDAIIATIHKTTLVLNDEFKVKSASKSFYKNSSSIKKK